MTLRSSISLGVLAPCLLLFVACSGDDALVGVGRQPQSEVLTQRSVPLIVPPDFGLRSDDGAGEVNAGGTVIDQRESENITVSSLNVTIGEQQLLNRAGAQEADPLIRARLNRDNAILAGRPRFVDLLLFGDHPAASGAVVDTGQVDTVTSDVVIEQEVEESSWFDDAWDSLGQ